MSFLDKFKNVFFEEEEIEEEKEEKLAKKVEIPRKEQIKIQKEEISNVDIPKEEDVMVVKPKADASPLTEENNKISMMFEEEDFVLEKPKAEKIPIMSRESLNEHHLYPEKKEESYTDIIKKENNYGYTKTYYESKTTKTFTPSPIISPIYGILDKNYKKEEVITKREVRITSNRDKMDFDSIRNKAFGDNVEEKEESLKSSPKKEKEVNIYDVNKEKPTVKGVTLKDADEYYNDLGLAYNVDYSDKGTTQEKKKKNTSKEEDNLFDLIESMYDKED